MSGFELRPLSLGELLDRAFLLYRRNFWLFCGIMLVPAVLVVIPRFFYLKNQGVPIPWARPAPQSGNATYTIVLIIVDWIVYAVAQSAIAFGVADVYLGRPGTIRASYGKVRGRFWRVMGVSLNIGVRVFGLMFLLVFGTSIAVGAAAGVARGAIPTPFFVGAVIALVVAGFVLAIAFSLRYALSLPAMLLEEIKGGAAIRRSVQLSEGRRGQLFLAILLGVLVVYAVAILFQGPFYAGFAVTGMNGHVPAWLALSMSITGAVGGAIAGPLLMIVLVLCYYDARVRKEGFDLQHLMNSLPESGTAVAGPAVSGPVA